MSKAKAIIILLSVFVLAIILSFYCEESYHALVRSCYVFFSDGNIQFTGKNLQLFASAYFLFSFGIYCCTLSWLFYRRKKNRLLYFLSTIFIAFATTILLSYLDYFSIMTECTGCKSALRFVGYNQINYDCYFITSLGISLLWMIVTGIQRKRVDWFNNGAVSLEFSPCFIYLFSYFIGYSGNILPLFLRKYFLIFLKRL